MRITIEKELSSKKLMSNSGDEQAEYSIMGNVEIKNGDYDNIQNGRVMDSGGRQVAFFNEGLYTPLNIGFNVTTLTAEERQAVFSELSQFLESLRGNDNEENNI